ncbi:MAG: ferrous iron transport protein A [Verrucomicrobia bacterium]|nr:ferrous iron transport protein A [Verrucomicrobiota bacterium]MCG2678464.1 ferrous iron transport protein A [Kiritimatiellia bacterium]MBU4248066.1 ferrous iron transport protein A [Verrucomicrobiota bacterium]MBU4290222.1 ferrous iron transport protein A [Verrucomicrobiota bacterium]MBU4430221.1 ferrous iron transport protein A [Verrucomicrobiota bacterium]
MNEQSLALLKQGDTATIIALHGGCGFQHRVRSVGLKEGKLLRMVAKHHFAGPLVVEVERRHITIGRGMAQKIIVARAL